MIFSVPELPFQYGKREWPVVFPNYDSVAEIITISDGLDGDQCHIHGHILRSRAPELYSAAEYTTGILRGDVLVEARGDSLHLFTNWIYNGTILLPDENDDPNNPLTFENACQAALKDAQAGLPVTRRHRWIKTEGETSSVEGMEVPQARLSRLVDLYAFAHHWDIDMLMDDILETFAISLRVANKLPEWRIVNRACRSPGMCELRDFLVDLFAMNWSSKIAESFREVPDGEKNAAFAALVMHKITRRHEKSVSERERQHEDILRNGKQAVSEAALEKQRLVEAEKELAKMKRSLAEAQAKLAKMGQEKKSAAKTKTVARTKREREEEVDRSELFKQSLKRPRRELRPRASAGSSKLAC